MGATLRDEFNGELTNEGLGISVDRSIKSRIDPLPPAGFLLEDGIVDGRCAGF